MTLKLPGLLIISIMLIASVQAQVPTTGSPETAPRQLLPDSRPTQATVSRRQASDIARRNFEGRVLSIVRDAGNWRVRMDRDGTVFNVFVDTSSGEVSRPSE